jgi:hypothetical protein
MLVGKSLLHGKPAAERLCHHVEAGGGVVESGAGVCKQRLGGLRHPVAAAKQHLQQLATAGLRVWAGLRQPRVLARPSTLHRVRRMRHSSGGRRAWRTKECRKLLERETGTGRRLRPRASVDTRCGALLHLCGHPARQGGRKEVRSGAAFLRGAQRPVERRLHHRVPGLGEERRNPLEPLPCVLQALGERREVARDQAEHAEDGLAGPHRGIAMHEMPALVLGQGHVEGDVGKCQVHVRREFGDGVIRHAARLVEGAAQQARLVGGARKTGR